MSNAISLFSGAGGCSLGLRGAGYSVKLAVDIDETACASYATNLDSNALWKADLATIDPSSLLARSGISASQVGLIVGGPPCQGFSSAGARDWQDPRNSLLRHFVEIITILKPVWFVMENVEGLLTANGGFYIIEAITRFLKAGYWVRAKKVYMEEYGLPQKRKRLMVVGNLEEYDFDFPEPLFYDLQPSLFNARQQLNILDAIGDLPTPSSGHPVVYETSPRNNYQSQLRRLDGLPIRQHEMKQVNAVTQQRIGLLTQGATMKSLPKNLQHPSFTRRSLRRVMDGTPTEKRGGPPSGLKRLAPNEPALTITSAAPAEFVHPVQDRLLTLRECARLQSFPDWYEFKGSWSSIATQIGNAIPPLYMKLLATHIQKLASWQPSPSSTGRWLGIDATKSTGLSPALARMLAQLEEKTYAFTR